MTRASIRWPEVAAWAVAIGCVAAAVYVCAVVLPLFTGVR